MNDQVNWELDYSQRAARALRKLNRTDRLTARRILDALERLATLDDPGASCKALSGELTGLWRLRVGDWRVILDIDRGHLVLLSLDVDHRSSVY